VRTMQRIPANIITGIAKAGIPRAKARPHDRSVFRVTQRR